MREKTGWEDFGNGKTIKLQTDSHKGTFLSMKQLLQLSVAEAIKGAWFKDT